MTNSNRRLKIFPDVNGLQETNFCSNHSEEPVNKLVK